MEEPSQSVELVHVLRHSFRPSEQLQSSLEAFIKPGSVRPRFLIKTLSSIALTPQFGDSHAYNPATRRAVRAFEVHNQPIQLGSKLGARRIGDGALRLFFNAENNEEITNLIHETLDELGMGTIVDDVDSAAASLFVQIDSTKAIGKDELAKPGIALRNQLNSDNKHLFKVVPDLLLGRDEQRTIPSSIAS